ncbi:DUF2066 domain-containing protein [Dyella nitratireducens]|uniref:DUF2066 domain-containing protein n=1 Tax=Dyella nitratireducens TaxID=1849580 RepID=A0ABQ1FNZ7_9GAMM|nr:DUF2066 domain-containing protein [Dyella nitratireducens]GGA22306.1 hypothetical protein GCM10010981_08120 [Dyella nitratireducens]GLQ44128.1 hypothetical protein GCM10007902_39780 [Dyella nitratireducens]
MRLPRLPIALLLFGLALGLAPMARGQTTNSPYTVVIPVTDTSAAQRSQAFQSALGQVLVRVSGGQDLSSKPGYPEALQNAAGIVKQFQYQADGGNPPTFTLTVSFDQGAVQRLVTQLGATTAGVRPPLLLVVKAGDGHLLNQNELGALTGAINKGGYQVSYADDPSQLPDLGKLAGADPAALSAISRIYHTGLVLIGDLHANSADWTLISGGQSQHWNAQGTDQNGLFADAGQSATGRLGQALNVIATADVNGTLWVSGLHSAMDYASLLATLRADPSVRTIATVGAQDDGVMLSVKAGMPLDNLVTNLAAGGRVMAGDSHDGADASLRWLH